MRVPPALGIAGVLLLAAGIVFLVAEYLPIDLGHLGWPLFVIGPGVLLLLLGLVTRDLAGLVVPGAIVTMTGLLLGVQNAFNLWASWAYAWALVCPVAGGLGTALYGRLRGDAALIRRGLYGVVAGLILFVVLGAFFEGVLGLDGLGVPLGRLMLPIFLVGVGVVLIAIWVLSSVGRLKSPPGNRS